MMRERRKSRLNLIIQNTHSQLSTRNMQLAYCLVKEIVDSLSPFSIGQGSLHGTGLQMSFANHLTTSITLNLDIGNKVTKPEENETELLSRYSKCMKCLCNGES